MVKKALTLLTSVLIALPLLMPFNIYASATHQVQTDYLSTVNTNWRNSMVFTSYCEGTNASTASCVLTVNITKSPKNYFGTVTIHGYDSSGTKWINYGDIFVSAGTGVYNYNFYQNGIKEISKVEVYSTNLIQPSSTVDLSQIISLLTSINSYNQQIVGNQSTQIQEIQTVINDLIISNGYLETITKLRSFNIPIESYLSVIPFLKDYEIYSYQNIYDLNYPTFKIPSGTNLFYTYTSANIEYTFIFIIDINLQQQEINNIFEISNYKTVTLDNSLSSYVNNLGRIYKLKVVFNTYENQYIKYIGNSDRLFIPIYYNPSSRNNISTDFALRFGLSNKLLDDLDIIVNGTVQSNSASQSSDNANSQLQIESNTLFQQENGFKSDMQNAMQNVNNTFRLQDMGIKFVSSAQWVRTQYENLTNNTPFASLITFSLITGLALILLGKVYK